MSEAPLWQPDAARRQRSQMNEFLTHCAGSFGIPAEWEALRGWSCTQRSDFWSEMLRFAEVEPSHPASAACAGEGMLGTRWFPGMELNYARHMLRFDDDAPALIFESENGYSVAYTHRKLRNEVARCAAALRRTGVTKGDRVAGYLPNVPETVIAMLAAASLGAVWSSCSPDFGVSAVLDRFGQIEPAVLFVCDRYFYGGREISTLERAPFIVDRLPSVRAVVIVPYFPGPLAAGNTWREDAYDRLPLSTKARHCTWREFLDDRRYQAVTQDKFPDPPPAPPLSFVEVPFDHPLFILYSSGTTGVPKCIVHGHGGTLLQHMKELMLHCDLRAGERIFYFTTCGWMMWNWLVSGLGVGAAVVLFDGNPAWPDADRLWKLAARLKVNVFGTSPKFLAACEKADLRPGLQHDLAALRAILSTGAPLSADLFRWVYRVVKSELQLSSISGGTDIISCFMLGNPLLPVYAGEIQCRGLGMDVHAWDESRRPVVGQKGELVCISPFPSQPVGFWNDPGGAKYRAAYFEHYPGVWRHGDFIEISPHGGVIVFGRSDATLNPGGVRIGTAEIYRVVEALPEVADSIVVSRETADADVEIVLFVVLRAGHTLDDDLKRKIAGAIAAGASKRHVPRHIRQVSAVPYTISGKKVELAVQQRIHGREVKNRDALANPESLEQFQPF